MVDDDVTQDEDGAAGSEAEPESRTDEAAVEDRPPGRLVGTLSWVLPALAVVLLVLSLVLGGLLYRQHNKDSARNAAVTAAKQVLINAYTVDYRTVSTDYQRFINGTSGNLRSELTGGKSKFISTVTSTHTHETAQILTAGIVRSDSNSATVAIALNSPLTTTTIKQPQDRAFRTEVDVVRVDGKWLATRLAQVD